MAGLFGCFPLEGEPVLIALIPFLRQQHEKQKEERSICFPVCLDLTRCETVQTAAWTVKQLFTNPAGLAGFQSRSLWRCLLTTFVAAPGPEAAAGDVLCASALAPCTPSLWKWSSLGTQSLLCSLTVLFQYLMICSISCTW